MNVRSRFRKVGGSTMIAVPPAMLAALAIEPGAEVSLEAKGGKLVVSPASKPAPSLADLIAQCDRKAKAPPVDKAWVASGPRGKEIL
jgi:antitoxin ChpS